MGDVSPRSRTRIELRQTAPKVTQEPLRLCPSRGPETYLREHQRHKIGQRALFDDEAAIHVCLPDLEIRIEEGPELRNGGRKADGYRRSATVADGESLAARGGHPEVSRADERGERIAEKPPGRPGEKGRRLAGAGIGAVHDGS